jgi:hypothetical protein
MGVRQSPTCSMKMSTRETYIKVVKNSPTKALIYAYYLMLKGVIAVSPTSGAQEDHSPPLDHLPTEKWNYLATSDQANHPWRATLRAMWPIILMQHVCVCNMKTYANYNDFGDHLPIWINFKLTIPIVIV